MGQNMGNIGEANWGDLDTGEKTARLGMGAAKGFGQGLQNYQQQNAMMRQGGGGAPIPAGPQAPPVQIQPQNFTPGDSMLARGSSGLGPPSMLARGSGGLGPGSMIPRGRGNPFFYGYGDQGA